jgi:endonuclease/exonuclease/phosphatase family metal-dependent hydrolase
VSFRVATYNIHRCRGLDGRVSAERIVKVLEEVNANIVGLQETLSVPGFSPEADQPRFIADALGMHYSAASVRTLAGGAYGNVVLSRFPFRNTCQYDLSVRGREARGCMRADIEIGERLLHVFNVHLGTDFFERRHQARKLIAPDLLCHDEIDAPRIVLGDFNEWTRGLASRLLATHLESADIRKHLNRSKTYPGVLPLMHLDHIYHDHDLKLATLHLHRSRTALVASDHLPLYADFVW